MSTKARYITPQQAPAVAAALRRAGYTEATPALCTEYAINVACRFDIHNPGRVHALIDSELDGYAVDNEGYAYEEVAQ